MESDLPRLRPDDHRLWEGWRRTAFLHSKTQAHRRVVDAAKQVVDAALRVAPNSANLWSAGKDSTVLSHLIRVGLGVRCPVLSEKDDLDYPGELSYVGRLAALWDLDLRVLTPPVSPAAWIAKHAAELEMGADIHGRAAGLSKACFYEVVEKASAGFDGIFLGLRQEESAGRAADRATHHTVIDGRRQLDIYRRRSGANPGQWKATPLGGWRGIDVYAYAEQHEIELLPLYQCIAFMHAREPWRLRKSWWIPGSSSRHGGVAWLAHYYPALFARLRGWFPAAASFR